MIIDSHAHYARHTFNDTFRFLDCRDGGFAICEGSREEILAEMARRGIAAWVEPAVEFGSNAEIQALCKKYPGRAFAAAGVHPTRVQGAEWKNRAQLRGYAADDNTVAIGETGLDFHRPRKEQHRLKQLCWFVYQIRLAHSVQKPLVLHIRQAYGPAMLILRLHKGLLHGGVAHCFCGTPEEAEALVKLGFHIGIGGALLHKNDAARRLAEAVKSIPPERILIETDAPYVPPYFSDDLSKKQQRKIRNTSLILPAVLSRIAEIKGLDEKTLEEIVHSNTVKLFRLPEDLKQESGCAAAPCGARIPLSIPPSPLP